MEKKIVYVVAEMDLLHIQNVYGVYDCVKKACEATKEMLSCILLFDSDTYEKNPLDSEMVENYLKKEKYMMVYSSECYEAMLIKKEINQSGVR